jgi:cobalt-zinc-cadmium efflux system outer membrane protein
MPRSFPSTGPLAVAALLLVAGGCASRGGIDPQAAADDIRARTGATARVEGKPAAGLPPGITVDDGLTQDEAVAVALWNNADFQVSVSDLGFARADLLEAGLLRNPVLALLFPVGPKQFEGTLRLPIEVLWERPRRVAAARVAGEVVAQRLVQSGLELAASVKVAHTDLLLAQDRQRLSDEAAALFKRIDQLTQSRLAAGDVSELEARAAHVDAARLAQDAARTRHDVEFSRVTLRSLLGFGLGGPAFEAVAPAGVPRPCGSADTLLRDALASRPDVRAAELNVEAAAKRMGWERSRILALTAVLDANGQGREGFEMGPGLDIGLPMFDRNQAGRARATAELQRASATYVAVQQRTAGDLRQAAAQFEQARESLAAWQTTILAPLQENVKAAERSFAEGDTSYLFVLDHARRLVEARVREREIEADLWRARARIERAIGRGCGTESGS